MAEIIPGGLLDRVANRRMARQINPMREALVTALPAQGMSPETMSPQQAMIAAAAQDPLQFADLARRTEGGALALGSAMQRTPRSREIVVHPEDELNKRLQLGLKDAESATVKLNYDGMDRQLPGFEITQYKTSADNTEPGSARSQYPSGTVGRILLTNDIREANGQPKLTPEETETIFREASMTSTDQQAYRRFREQQLAAGVPEGEIPDSIDFKMTFGAGNAFATGVGTEEAARMKDYQDKAVAAVPALRSVEAAYELIDTGLIAGAAAEPRLALVRALDTILGRTTDAKSAATDAYLAASGQRVAEAITSFGAGTGLSDADRDFARLITAGKIDMTPQALRMALEILARGKLGEVNRYNQQKANLQGNFAYLRPFLQDVQVPETIYGRISPLARAPAGATDEEKLKFYLNQRPSYLPQGANQQLPPDGGSGPTSPGGGVIRFDSQGNRIQ